MKEGALGSAQRLRFALSAQEVLVEELHQLVRGVILYRPQADYQGIRPDGQESAAKSQLFVAAPAHCQAGFTAAQCDQLATLQIQAEGIDGVKLPVSQQDRGEVGRVQPAVAVRSQVNDGTAWSLLNEPDDGGILFEIAATIQHGGKCFCLIDGAPQVSLTGVPEYQRRLSSRRSLALRCRKQTAGRQVVDLELFYQEARPVIECMKGQRMERPIGDNRQEPGLRRQERRRRRDQEIIQLLQHLTHAVLWWITRIGPAAGLQVRVKGWQQASQLLHAIGIFKGHELPGCNGKNYQPFLVQEIRQQKLIGRQMLAQIGQLESLRAAIPHALRGGLTLRGCLVQ